LLKDPCTLKCLAGIHLHEKTVKAPIENALVSKLPYEKVIILKEQLANLIHSVLGGAFVEILR